MAEGVFGRIMTDWNGLTIDVERLLQDDDVVVALGRYRATYRATGRPLDAQFVHVWTLRDGRLTRFQQYADTLQFARVTEGAGVAATAPRSAAGMPRTDAAEATPVR